MKKVLMIGLLSISLVSNSFCGGNLSELVYTGAKAIGYTTVAALTALSYATFNPSIATAATKFVVSGGSHIVIEKTAQTVSQLVK